METSRQGQLINTGLPHFGSRSLLRGRESPGLAFTSRCRLPTTDSRRKAAGTPDPASNSRERGHMSLMEQAHSRGLRNRQPLCSNDMPKSTEQKEMFAQIISCKKWFSPFYTCIGKVSKRRGWYAHKEVSESNGFYQRPAGEQFPESGLESMEGNSYENTGVYPRCFPCLDSEQRRISLVSLHAPKISSFQNVCLDVQSGCALGMIFKVWLRQ